MKIAIVLSVMPRSIQEYVYSNIGTEDTYENTVYKMKVMAGQKAAMDVGGPVPMVIGELGRDREKLKKIIQEVQEESAGGETMTGGEENVDAVGMHTKCHRCGGYGHLARECATAAKGVGKGYGGKGGSKGSYSHHYSGKGGFGSKGKGKFPGQRLARRSTCAAEGRFRLPGDLLQLRKSLP